MALSADTIRKIRDSQADALRVKASSVVYKGSVLAVGSPDHATAGNRGRAEAWASTTEQIPAGLADLGVTGNTGETERVPAHLFDYILEDVAVTGASTQAHVGSKVYWSDDNTLTLTRPTLGLPAGRILAFNSATSFDCFMYGIGTLDAISLGGNGQDILHIGTVVTELSSGGDLLKGILAPYHGRVLSVYAICASAPTDADMDIDATLEINGTNTTGGVIELVTADTIGLKKTGTAITGSNVFKEGDAIDVEATVNTAGTAGDGIYNIYAEVERLLGV